MTGSFYNITLPARISEAITYEFKLSCNIGGELFSQNPVVTDVSSPSYITDPIKKFRF